MRFSRCDIRHLPLQEFEKQLLPTAMRMMQPSSSFNMDQEWEDGRRL